MSTDAEWISVNETLARFSMSRSTFYRHRDRFITKLLGGKRVVECGIGAGILCVTPRTHTPKKP